MIYLKYGDIKGNVTESGHKDWIELDSFQFGAGRGISSARGSGSNREANEPSLSEITVSKAWDPKSSALLLQEAVSGTLDHTAQLHFTTTGGNKQETFLEIKLEQCGISGYSITGGRDDRPSETFSLNYAKIEVTPNAIMAGLTKEKGVVVAYDLTKMMANA